MTGQHFFRLWRPTNDFGFLNRIMPTNLEVITQIQIQRKFGSRLAWVSRVQLHPEGNASKVNPIDQLVECKQFKSDQISKHIFTACPLEPEMQFG